MLQVDHLHVEVVGRTVLHDIDLRLAPGEGNVVFGPNGACDDEATALGAAYLAVAMPVAADESPAPSQPGAREPRTYATDDAGIAVGSAHEKIGGR